MRNKAFLFNFIKTKTWADSEHTKSCNFRPSPFPAYPFTSSSQISTYPSSWQSLLLQCQNEAWPESGARDLDSDNVAHHKRAILSSRGWIMTCRVYFSMLKQGRIIIVKRNSEIHPSGTRKVPGHSFRQQSGVLIFTLRNYLRIKCQK